MSNQSLVQRVQRIEQRVPVTVRCAVLLILSDQDTHERDGYTYVKRIVLTHEPDHEL